MDTSLNHGVAAVIQLQASGIAADALAEVSPEAPAQAAPAELVGSAERAGTPSIAVRTLEGEGVAIYLPLCNLRVDERNARRDGPSQTECNELADLMDAQGLLQNLTVIAYDPLSKRLGAAP